MLYVDKLLNTPFRVLARMVDTLACRRVEMLLAETLQVFLSLAPRAHTRLLSFYSSLNNALILKSVRIGESS